MTSDQDDSVSSVSELISELGSKLNSAYMALPLSKSLIIYFGQ
jgi:hypothetical protein